MTTEVTAEGGSYASAPRRLEFVDAAAPAPGRQVEIAAGVRWLRLPLPMSLNHINVWLLETAQGWVLVDTGLSADVTRAAWEVLEREVFRQQPLHLIVLTHFHPDHVGLAAWLQERHGVPVWMSRAGFDRFRMLMAVQDDVPDDAALRFLAAHGVSNPQELKSLGTGRSYRKAASGLPRVEWHPSDGEIQVWNDTRWQFIETAGHAEGHLCMHDAAGRVLISGDQVLPGISPNVSLTWRTPDPDPVGSFLGSLHRLSGLAEDTLVLPSHGLPFRGLQRRADDLCHHHQAQLAAIMSACVAPRTACEVLPVLFRRELQGFNKLLGLGEAVAHLEHLARQQRLVREVAVDGLIRYVAASP